MVKPIQSLNLELILIATDPTSDFQMSHSHSEAAAIIQSFCCKSNFLREFTRSDSLQQKLDKYMSALLNQSGLGLSESRVANQMLNAEVQRVRDACDMLMQDVGGILTRGASLTEPLWGLGEVQVWFKGMRVYGNHCPHIQRVLQAH
jgi:hypothetical protein